MLFIMIIYIRPHIILFSFMTSYPFLILCIIDNLTNQRYYNN